MTPRSSFWKTTGEAAFWTFIEYFCVTIGPAVAVAPKLDWSALSGALVASGLAGLAAVASLVKSVAVRRVGTEDTPFISG